MSCEQSSRTDMAVPGTKLQPTCNQAITYSGLESDSLASKNNGPVRDIFVQGCEARATISALRTLFQPSEGESQAWVVALEGISGPFGDALALPGNGCPVSQHSFQQPGHGHGS